MWFRKKSKTKNLEYYKNYRGDVLVQKEIACHNGASYGRWTVTSPFSGEELKNTESDGHYVPDEGPRENRSSLWD